MKALVTRFNIKQLRIAVGNLYFRFFLHISRFTVIFHDVSNNIPTFRAMFLKNHANRLSTSKSTLETSAGFCPLTDAVADVHERTTNEGLRRRPVHLQVETAARFYGDAIGEHTELVGQRNSETRSTLPGIYGESCGSGTLRRSKKIAAPCKKSGLLLQNAAMPLGRCEGLNQKVPRQQPGAFSIRRLWGISVLY